MIVVRTGFGDDRRMVILWEHGTIGRCGRFAKLERCQIRNKIMDDKIMPVA
jgi:hypothetical protein